jgi:Fe2+ or Zn2+ uptake regulation protein
MKVRLLVKAKLHETLHTGLLIDLDRNKVFRIRDDKLWELLQELSQNHEIDIKTPEDIEAVRPLVDLAF